MEFAPVGARSEQPAGLEPLTGQHAPPHGVRSLQPPAHTAPSTAQHEHRHHSATVTQFRSVKEEASLGPIVHGLSSRLIQANCLADNFARRTFQAWKAAGAAMAKTVGAKVSRLP